MASAERHDVVVIGGGQAGLAMSAVLRERGREHVVLERRRVAERWQTERWDSLRFQFPNWALELPGQTYKGDAPDDFAHYREIVAFLQEYAAGAPVREHTEVVGLAEDGDGFVVSLKEGALRARQVVVATGPFHRPAFPRFDIPPSVLQTDPTRYRNPADLPEGAVLVVGSGASGFQIADELRMAGRRVFLSVSRHKRVPRRFRGKDMYWWLGELGRWTQTIDSFPDRVYPPSTVVTGVNGGYDVDVRRLAADGVTVVGRVLGASGDTLAIRPNANQILDEADQSFDAFMKAACELLGEQPEEVAHLPGVEEVESLDLSGIGTIIWATGYAYDYGWLKMSVFDGRGRPVQQRGVTPRPGLYFLGLHWMHTFKSGLLAGVGADAEYVADQMSR
ncbi:hypothetical protein Lesp02_69550 [Lentzea sp. NBRC 105346]|uniref:NAD(P)-binding domain-containing protein n=1 Tax=Lentzea sp. NBRC 105346 TaxID=3032205 RepID=UPI0024A01A68|nr:NAD(P)-binding domain-containing protein [Lentzea sp. NBRC 105346]GLZ34768.1 hypothetical protein Lesp02_69550 [Lentzea sp. NBRC 105346]